MTHRRLFGDSITIRNDFKILPVFILSEDTNFPPPHLATKEGLLAVGGDLSPERLLSAYRSGIFPWYSDGDPILWWSPDPRLILYPDQVRVSRSLNKVIRRQAFRITMNADFPAVISACAVTLRRCTPGTWITDEMRRAYCRLHALGHAHSVEAWHEDQLVGGLYGVAMGRCFFGESMFSSMSNASKVALVHLGRHLHAKGFRLIDCQLPTDHLISMGAVKVSRKKFLSLLASACQD